MVGDIILMLPDTYMHAMIEVVIFYIWLKLVWGHKFPSQINLLTQFNIMLYVMLNWIC